MMMMLIWLQEPEDKIPYDKKSPLHVYIYCAICLLFGYYFNAAVVTQYRVGHLSINNCGMFGPICIVIS